MRIDEACEHAVLDRRARSDSSHNLGRDLELSTDRLQMLAFKCGKIKLIILKAILVGIQQQCDLFNGRSLYLVSRGQ